MTHKRLILALFILSGLAVSCGTKKKVEVETDKTEKVKVEIVSESVIEKTLEYPTTIKAFEENYIAPAAPGRIEKIYADIGSRVSKGQKLIQMDRTQLMQAEVQLKTLETDVKRLETLLQTGSVAQQQYDQLKAQYDVAKTNVDFLRENTSIVAPFSGVISGKYFEDGEMYSGAPNTQAGKAAVVTLVQINNLKALVNVPEQYYPLVKPGMEIKIKSEIYPDKVFSAKIAKIYPTIDPTTHNFQTEIIIPNNNDLLRPGMFCRVEFEMGETKALIIPVNAILKLQGSNERFLFLVKDGKAHRVAVQMGKRYDDKAELISDEVKAGDMLIVSGQSKLYDQVPVEVVK